MSGRRRKSGWGALFTLLAVPAVAFSLAVYLGMLRLPPNLTPWGVIDIEQPPGPFVRMQINGLALAQDQCLVTLAKSDLEYKRIANRPVRNGCGLSNGVSITRSNVPYNGGVMASCPMAAALYVYERVLQDAARQELGSELTRIHHVGTYACRNINGAAGGRRSQHATANAIDVSAFSLADGRKVSVLRDWGADTPEGRFLEQVRDHGCVLFNTVLGPEYNARHRDHFHLDLGRTRICR